MTEDRLKALELAVQLYCGLSDRIKDDMAERATVDIAAGKTKDEQSPSVEKLVLGFADDFLEYIRKQ